MPIFFAASVRLPFGLFQGANDQLLLRFLHRQIIPGQHRAAGRPRRRPPRAPMRGRSRAAILSPRHSTTACSMAVRNSRTLPGQR